MNTKTMRLPPRRVSMPNKRKERDDFDLKPLTPAPPISKLPKPATPLAGSDKSAQPVSSSNQLFAGYLAHEFLTCGTLFGQLWDPTRSQAAESRKEEVSEEKAKPSEAAEADPDPEPEPEPKPNQRYVEVAYLLKADGAHIPGIVNPSQLARLLQM